MFFAKKSDLKGVTDLNGKHVTLKFLKVTGGNLDDLGYDNGFLDTKPLV